MHWERVDELLADFESTTRGCLMSPSTMSWKRGNKGARLDHIVTWNLPPESSAGVLGARWRKVGTEIPTGCTELDHPELAERLAYTVAFEKHELQSLRLQDLTAQSVVRVGEHVWVTQMARVTGWRE